jgi:hypothetical protein
VQNILKAILSCGSESGGRSPAADRDPLPDRPHWPPSAGREVRPCLAIEECGHLTNLR